MIAGIIMGHFTDILANFMVYTIIFMLIGQAVLLRIKAIPLLMVHGSVVFITMFCFGWVRMQLKQQYQIHEINTTSSAINIAKIMDVPEEKKNTFRSSALLLQQDSTIVEPSVFYLYIEKDSSVQSLKPGNIIAFSSFIQPIKNNGNPYEFDYKFYLQRRQILYQTFIKKGDWKLIDLGTNSIINKLGSNTKTYARQAFQKYVQQHAIVSAMILGERNELDDHLKSEFSHAGIMHILAISGLHVGLILLFLNGCLIFLSVNQVLRTLRIVIIIICLWIYAWLTGFSPSVVRATVMFTFFTVGQLTSRKANSYNILAFAAFTMLVINPYNIFEVGFQLSFVAVLSILFFYPKIYHLVRFRYLITDKCWQIISVSLAAQVLTFPLTIFYFHQFSTWFLLANLIAIPMVFLVVLFSLVLLAVSPFHTIAIILGKTIDCLIDFLLSGTHFVNSLPGNLLSGLGLNLAQLMFIYLIIGSVMMFSVTFRKQYILYMLFFMMVFVNIKNLNTWNQSRKNELVVFNISGNSAISLINGQHAFCFLSDTSDHSSISYATDNYLIHRNVWKSVKIQSMGQLTYPTMNLFDESIFFRFQEKDIVILKDNVTLWTIPDRLKIDYLIISSGSDFVSLQEITKVFQVKTIIIDSSVKHYAIKKMLDGYETDKYDVHTVSQDGAFVLKI